MHKIIILNFPTHGCINPLLATVAELVRRGERVIYYCTEEFRTKIEKTGAEFRPYKGLINEFKYQENDDLFEALKLTVEMTADKLDCNLDIIRKENPDFIIHDSMCAWGKHIAAILGIPAINLMHSYPITKSSISFSAYSISFLLKIVFYKLQNNLIKTLKKRYDIDFSVGDIMINSEKVNIVFTSKEMELDVFQSEKSYRFVGPSLFFKHESDNFPFSKLKNKKVIFISLGTLHNKNQNFYQMCLEAFRNTDYYVVISVGSSINLNELTNIPDNFMIKQSVPQQKLLQHVDLFITHAGMNSVNEAICNGVPMLLLPHQFEQEMIARRVKELGIGIKKNIKKITQEQLFTNATQIISDLNYKKQALKFKSIFIKEENTSAVTAVNEILHSLTM